MSNNIKISNVVDPKVVEQNYRNIIDEYKAIVDSPFELDLSDVFICDEYLRRIRDEISGIVKGNFMCVDITSIDEPKLIALIDMYVCDRDMYDKFINSDDLGRLKKAANTMLSNDKIKRAMRAYHIVKIQREHIIASRTRGDKNE